MCALPSKIHSDIDSCLTPPDEGMLTYSQIVSITGKNNSFFKSIQFLSEYSYPMICLKEVVYLYPDFQSLQDPVSVKVQISAIVLKSELGESEPSNQIEISSRTQIAFDHQMFCDRYIWNTHPSPRPEMYEISNGWNEVFLSLYSRFRPTLLFLPPYVKYETLQNEFSKFGYSSW